MWLITDKKVLWVITVKSRSNGFQGTKELYLLWVEFCYSQFRKYKKTSSKGHEIVSVVSRNPFKAGPLERGSTVLTRNEKKGSVTFSSIWIKNETKTCKTNIKKLIKFKEKSIFTTFFRSARAALIGDCKTITRIPAARSQFRRLES